LIGPSIERDLINRAQDVQLIEGSSFRVCGSVSVADKSN
ncbi:unnamed protein product, partial [Musa acuminata subsp. burmannicoides]